MEIKSAEKVSISDRCSYILPEMCFFNQIPG